MKRFFFGGVHPAYRKELSDTSDAIRTVSPRHVIIPLKQHVGNLCTPLVKVGERVLLGQKIGDGEGMCVPVHASVSGRVIAIEARPHPAGGTVQAIVIENDYQNEEAPQLPISPDTADADAVLHAIREAGIVGMGGAAFPGDIKALSAMGKIDTLIANACECEPYITADDYLLRSDPRPVLQGMMLLARILHPDRILLAIEDNKPRALQQIRTLQNEFPDIAIAVLPARYPQGSEKQLIQAVSGRQVPPGGLPSHVGCVVFNVSTYAAIYRAVCSGKPLTRRIVTVSGEAVQNPQNLIVPIGTPFSDLIEEAGGLREGADRVINGGPMMGVAQKDLSVPVVKATNSVLCLPRDPGGAKENPVCIRCGKCLSVCPMHLQPLYFYRFTLSGRTEALRRLNITDCMECGSCAFICPGKLPLVEKIRLGKSIIKEESQR